MKQDGRVVRTDLTKEELERLEKFGSIGFKSIRNANKMSHGAVQKHIPSQEQH